MLSASRLADTYMMASRAKSKLTKEAAKPEYDLRILVSHANFLDNLMDDLARHRQSQKSAAISSANKVHFADEPIRHGENASGVNYTENEYNYDYGYDGSYEDSDSDLDEEEENEYVLGSSSSDEEEEEYTNTDSEDDQASIIDEFYEVTFLHKYHDSSLSTIKEEDPKSIGSDAFSYDNIKVTSNAVEESEEEPGHKGIVTVMA